MEAKLTRCLCKLSDCAYYQQVPGNSAECDCLHHDKARYMFNPCPLYRKEWARTSSAQLGRIKDILRRGKG